MLFLNDYDILTGLRLEQPRRPNPEVPRPRCAHRRHWCAGASAWRLVRWPSRSRTRWIASPYSNLPVRGHGVQFPGQRLKDHEKRGATSIRRRGTGQSQSLGRLLPHLFRSSSGGGHPDVGILGGSQLDPGVLALSAGLVSIPPPPSAYRDLIYKQWWTSWRGQTDAQGHCEVRAFFGKHRVTAGGREIVVNLKRKEPKKQISFKQP